MVVTIEEALDEMGKFTAGTYDPAQLAWELIINDELEDFKFDIAAFTDINDTEEDIITFMFETLINIYLEMIFSLAKLEHMIKQQENNEEITPETYKLNISDVTYENMIIPYREKFYKIGYFLSINNASDDDKKNSYCRVILKDDAKNKNYFNMNNINNKRFHFILNALYKKKNKLKDVLCIFQINGQTYKIYFEKYIVTV